MSHKQQGSISNVVLLAIGLAMGVALTVVTLKLLSANDMSHSEQADSAESAPLYWVAPMDPNFRRDEPGLSPMGMDLVPVYADGAGDKDSPGTIKIHPNVVNNLGVRTAKAERRALNVTIKTVGYVQYNEDTLVHVHPRVEGWIEDLNVKAAGEYVQKGDPLYALYSPELVNAQEEFLLAVKRNNKNLMSAAQSRLQALQMPQQAIKKLITLEKVQQSVIFTAPQTGFIDNLNIREGFYVKPGMTLMSIAALDEVWVDAEIFERQSNLVKLDLPVTMTMQYLPGKTWQGKVDYIYPTLDARTRTLRVRLRFNNDGYFLKPNMFANVSIFTGLLAQDKSARAENNALQPMPTSALHASSMVSSHSEPGGTSRVQASDSTASPAALHNIVVPSEAVIRTGTQNRVVLALGDGKFKSVAVAIGNVLDVDADAIIASSQNNNMAAHSTVKAGSYTEILSGLLEGDTVVTSAQFLLDSESSISSDFIRIGGELQAPNSMDEHSKDKQIDMMDDASESPMSSMQDMQGMQGMQGMGSPVWVEASVDDVMPDERTVRLTHEDIDDWGMPGMTMNFLVHESVNFAQLEVGKTLQVQLQKGDSVMFEVIGVKP